MVGASVIGLAAAGGSIGCVLRVLVRDACAAAGLPKWQGIAVVNIIGSAAAGAIVAAHVPEWWQSLLLVGLCGGFTSFSAMALDMVALWVARRRGSALVLGISTITAAPIAALGALTATAAATARATATPFVATRGARPRMALVDAAVILVGGSVGCAIRAAVVLGAQQASVPDWTATTTCNVVGSALAAVAARALISQGNSGEPLTHPALRAHLDRLILLGLCGGLTTVSSLAVEMAELARESLLHAVALGAVNVVAGCFAAAGGWWLVRFRYPLRDRLEHELEAAVP